MGTQRQMTAEQDLRQLVVALGNWFDGFGKFAMIVNGRCENLDNGQMLMIQRLTKESHKINLFLHDWRERYRQESVRNVQQRLLAEGNVGAALNATYDEFWTDFLRDDEREVLPGGRTKERAFSLCLWGPIAAMFKSPQGLSWLSDDPGAELLMAAVNDGVVRVRIGDSETEVVMEEHASKLIDSFSQAEGLDTQVDCEILIGGMSLQFEWSTLHKKDEVIEIASKTEIKGAIFDTSRSFDEDSIWEMLENKRVAAYGGVKHVVEYLNPKDIVFFSHKWVGIVAAAEVIGSVKQDGSDQCYRDVRWLTPVPKRGDAMKAMPLARLTEITGKTFFWTWTVKVPYLTRDEAVELLEELKAYL